MKTLATLAAGLALGLAAGVWYAKPDLRAELMADCLKRSYVLPPFKMPVSPPTLEACGEKIADQLR